MIGPDDLLREAARRGLEGRENRIAANLRGYTDVDQTEWLEIENTLLRLALDVATLDPERLPAPDGTSDLPLSLLSRSLWNTAREAPYQTNFLRSLGAVACAGAGNFPTAGLVAREALKSNQMGSFERWAVSILADPALKFVRDETPIPLRRYARAERDAIRSGANDAFDRADTVFAEAAVECCRSFAQGDAFLLMLWVQVRRRLRELSAARILLGTGQIEEPYVRALLRTSSPLLYPTQALAIERHGLLEPGRNALVILPTSTGKSLLGELAMLSALTDERPLGVYLAPYRALTDQIFRRMRVRLAQVHVRCEARRGGYLSDRPVTGETRTVLVATPEAFDAFLRIRPDLMDKIACCVFDEFHLVEQVGRGLRYEGLLGRLREQDETRIVALSPVVSPSTELREWLRIDDADIVQSSWRPTARRLAIAGPDRTAKYYTPGDHLGAAPTGPAWVGRIPFPNPIDRPPARTYAHELARHDAAVAENIAAVAIDQYERFERPVLILSSTREQTRTLAAVVAGSGSQVAEDHPARELARSIQRRCPYLFTLHTCLQHGVAYHNASLPNWIRERLELLMANQQLKIVAATTTLAEGVDLPFRVVVMADWRHWLFGQQRPMPTLLFRNIAGRCGRAGSFGEGDTVIVDNPGRTPGQQRFGDRYSEYVHLYVRPRDHHLQSAVAQAVAVGQQDAFEEIDAALESQFVAYVAINHPDEGREEAAFANSLFAGRFPGASQHVNGVAQVFVSDTLRDPEFAVLRRSSPLAVTDFGQTVLATGLSPRSGVSIARFLKTMALPADPRKGRAERQRHQIEWVPVLAALREAAATPNFVAELQGGAFHRVGRRGFPVNEANLLHVILGWVSGLPIEEITFLTLRNPDLRTDSEAWLHAPSGPPPDGLEAQIEQLAVFLHGYVAQQWSWVLRGAAALAEHVEDVDGAPLEHLAMRVEHGVRHELSAALIGYACPLDRSKIDWLVDRFVAGRGAEDESKVSESGFLEWIRANDALRGMQVGYFGGSRIDDVDLGALVAFLEERTDDEEEAPPEE